MNFGLIPDSPDSRDIMMSSLMAPVSIPIKIDLREYMGPVRSQGQEGVCGGMAAAGMKENQEWRESLEYKQLSPRYIYEMSRVIEPQRGEGTSLRALVKALHQFGICEEKFWPYKEGGGSPLKPGADENAKINRISGYVLLEKLEGVIESIVVNGPCIMGMNITPEWYNIPTDGMMKKVRSNAHIFGKHAIVGVGFDRSERLFLVRNSWGPMWGRGGYAWIPFQSIIEQMCGAWSATDLLQ